MSEHDFMTDRWTDEQMQGEKQHVSQPFQGEKHKRQDQHR